MFMVRCSMLGSGEAMHLPHLHRQIPLCVGSLCLNDLLLSVLGQGLTNSVMTLLIRTLILWNWGLTIMTPFNFKCFLEGPISNT